MLAVAIVIFVYLCFGGAVAGIIAAKAENDGDGPRFGIIGFIACLILWPFVLVAGIIGALLE